VFTRSTEEYVINLTLDSGIYESYSLLFSKSNFEKHQRNPSKRYYHECMKERFLEGIIPTIFKNSECVCKSLHRQKFNEPPKYVIYGIFQDYGTYKTYIRIPFYYYKRKRKIEILTYTPDIRDITENLCKVKSKNLKLYN
jgi:hypothetical protein